MKNIFFIKFKSGVIFFSLLYKIPFNYVISYYLHQDLSFQIIFESE